MNNKIKALAKVLAKVLASAQSPTGLRFVGIEILLYICPDLRKSPLIYASSIFKASEWSLVDEALSGPMFIDLRGVQIRVIAHTWGSPYDVDWTEVEQGRFMLFTRPSISMRAFISPLVANDRDKL